MIYLDRKNLYSDLNGQHKGNLDTPAFPYLGKPAFLTVLTLPCDISDRHVSITHNRTAQSLFSATIEDGTSDQ